MAEVLDVVEACRMVDPLCLLLSVEKCMNHKEIVPCSVPTQAGSSYDVMQDANQPPQI